MIKNPIYSGIKVKSTAVKLVKDLVKNGYYRINKSERGPLLESLNANISQVYNVEKPSLKINSSDSNHYSFNEIVVDKPSIISFLHEFRHHLQRSRQLRYAGMSIEQDARAWSMGIFNTACPLMFEKSVKNGKVFHLKWDSEIGKIVDNANYI